jgi:hypothetical protein
MDAPPNNRHPSYPTFTVIVRTPESTDTDLVIGFVYLTADQNGNVRYVGSTTNLDHRACVTNN